MNYSRVLHVMNWMLILIGYQMHWYERKSLRFRLSLWIMSYFCLISFIYVISFAHHFERSSLLHLLKDVSPFLHRLVRIQLLFGLKVFLFNIYETRMIARAINELSMNLPQSYIRKFSRHEGFAYILTFSTILIALACVIYIAYIMEFELPPLDDILIFCGICIPHFTLGGSLKLYNIGIWLIRSQLSQLDAEFANNVCVENDNVKELTTNDNEVSTIVKIDQNNEISLENKINLSPWLQEFYKCTQKLSKTTNIFNNIMQRQLTLLILLNSTCLLAGSYARVYYETSWKEIFLTRTKKIFQATNCSIFILIFWDYLTLCVTQRLFEKMRQKFVKRLQSVMKQRQNLTETSRFLLTDLYELLKENFSLKFMGTRVGFHSFLVLQIFIGLIISLVVIYHYLDDQIITLTERLDAADAEDEDDDK